MASLVEMNLKLELKNRWRARREGAAGNETSVMEFLGLRNPDETDYWKGGNRDGFAWAVFSEGKRPTCLIIDAAS